MHLPTLISRKREGDELSPREIRQLIAAYTSGDVPGYQMSAFAMAVFFKGMTPAETAALTRAMMESGDCFSHRAGHPPVVDKHSTGGIGDKVSLVLAPTTGMVTKVDAGLIGQAALQLGAGRAKANDGVDFAVGFDQLVKTGESIHAEQPLCRIHARSAVDLDMAEAMAGKAVRIASH